MLLPKWSTISLVHFLIFLFKIEKLTLPK